MSEKNRRLQRAEKEIREIISSYLTREQSGSSDDLICLTRVEVSRDLRNVKAFVCVIGQEEVSPEILKTLQSHAPFIQKLFSSRFRMKFCPKLRFFNDPSVRMLARIDQVIKQEKQNS